MSRIIAFFDFDGTITTRDSLLEFIKYTKGKPAFYFGFAINSPFLIAYKSKIISNQRAKEIMLRYFFGRMPAQKFNGLCESFSKDVLPGLVRPKAAKELDAIRNAGAEIVIVSASPENWVRHWCADHRYHCIATRLDMRNDRMTGRIEGLNCHGHEKVRRIHENFDLTSFDDIYCYGDTAGDKPMLSLGSKRFFKPFR